MATRIKRPVRLKDVARAADISIAAASMALADHPAISRTTKRRVVAVSRKLGYRKMPTGRPRGPRRAKPSVAARLSRVGLLLVGDRVDSESNTAILDRFMSMAAAGGFRMEVAAIDGEADDAEVRRRALAYAAGLDGLLLSGPVTVEDVEAVRGAGVPCVVLGQVAPGGDGSRVHLVAPDDMGMARRATAWLFARGHRRIGFACERRVPGFCHDRWLAGYRLAHHEAGAPIDPALLHESGRPLGGAGPAADHFAALDPCADAYVVPDIRIGASFVEAMRARGAEPAAGAIVIGGLRDAAQRYHVDHLPRLGPDIEQMAQASLDLLLSLRERPDQKGLAIYVSSAAENLD